MSLPKQRDRSAWDRTDSVVKTQACLPRLCPALQSSSRIDLPLPPHRRRQPRSLPQGEHRPRKGRRWHPKLPEDKTQRRPSLDRSCRRRTSPRGLLVDCLDQGRRPLESALSRPEALARVFPDQLLQANRRDLDVRRHDQYPWRSQGLHRLSPGSTASTQEHQQPSPQLLLLLLRQTNLSPSPRRSSRTLPLLALLLR